MKCHHVSMFMMTVTLAYSAPIDYEYESIEVATPTKPLLRQPEDTPGKCCSDGSQRCCPYDYDDRCETSNYRTLCGYNKNQKDTDKNKLIFTKFGLPCRINDDRLECGYNGPYVTDPLPNIPAGNPSGCCNCCNEQTTKAKITTTEATTATFTESATETTMESTTSSTKTLESSPETLESSPDTTETAIVTTESAEETKLTSYKKLVNKLTERSPPAPAATTCVTVEEKCQIVYEQPCIMDPPCQND